MTTHAKGLLLGLGAILVWSTSAATTVLAGGEMGPWQFLVVGCAVGVLTQAVVYRRQGYSWRRIFRPPPLLWTLIGLCLIPNILAITLGLVWAVNSTQKIGVSLVNYLWPTLTVFLAVLLVPGTKMRGRLLVAALLALAGLGLATSGEIRRAWNMEAGVPFSPYVLGFIAGLSWAMFSVLLSRWRDAGKDNPAAPLAFLLTALIAVVIGTVHHDWRHITPTGLIGAIYAGVGPLGMGFLLWEMALHRASASALGLLGSATPVLSTGWLLLLFHLVPTAGKSHASVPMLLISAGMIGAAVIVGRSNGNSRRTVTVSAAV